MELKPVENTISCPKCGADQQDGESCRHCGIIFHKHREKLSAGSRYSRPPIRLADSGFPYKTLIRLSQLILLISLLLLILSNHQRAILPEMDFYDGARLPEPVQSDTTAEPFAVVSNDILYTINPIYDYQLHGVVVSFHNSDAWWDIYHHRSWQDFINVKDICVIWGDNVASGVYRKMAFKNTTWTCWATWPDSDTGRQFSMHQLSNNHLLIGDPRIREIAENVAIGDQIRINGVLASYSHSNGRFARGTSTSRTDTGNGACETIFVNDFEIVKKANPGWHKINLLAGWLAPISFLCMMLLVFKAPVRPND